MAELVDALVSNTSGFTSMPVRSRLWVLSEKDVAHCNIFFCFDYSKNKGCARASLITLSGEKVDEVFGILAGEDDGRCGGLVLKGHEVHNLCHGGLLVGATIDVETYVR